MVRSVKRKAARMSSATGSNRASAALIDETDHSDGEARNSSTLSEHPTPGKDKPQTMIEYLEAQRNLALHNLQTQRDKALAQFREEAAQAKKKIFDSLAEGKEEAPSADSSSLSHEPPLPSAVKDETQLQHQTTSPAAASSSKPQRTYGEKKTIHIACTSGVYSGQHFTLVLSTDVNRVCLIGRSSGKKYKAPLGLSLPKDPEISTTHAEMRWSSENDHIYLADQNSTNGTKLNGRNLKARVPVRLDFAKPIHVGFGGCEFTMTM